MKLEQLAAKRLRHMAAGWQQTAEGTEKYGLAREKEADIAHYQAQAAALLAGAKALEQLQAINEFREENT